MSSVEVLATPVKSENDKKSYRLIRLKNGLQALLISVPPKTHSSANDSELQPSTTNDDNVNEIDDRKLAACALCVDVGYFSDPWNIQGLAHFLEHLILMGSEKYPNENDFTQFLQKSDGSRNAETGPDQTIFYFEVREEFLNAAMDRFSDFYKKPFLRKESMMREREAVDSEFSVRKSNELIRRLQILSSITQPGHPLGKFDCGNLKSLKDNVDDEMLHKKVHDFRTRHYSSHRMHFCVQSEQSLDNLQEMAVKYFSAIPNNNLPSDDFSAFNHQNTFQPKFHEKVYFVEPTSNYHHIDISWCMEPATLNFKCKPDSFVAEILAHQVKGSLKSYLHEKQWADEVSAGPGVKTNLFTLYSMNISLTEDGLNHLDEVLDAIFSYLKFLQQTGLNETLFREIQLLKANSFKFNAEQDARTNVEKLVTNMSKYPSEYIQTGDRLYLEYNPDAIKKFIDELNTRKFNITISSSRKYNDQVTYESTEPWYGSKYTEMDMPAKWIDLWKNAKPLPEFALPEPNPFIADDFTIFYEAGNTVPKYPANILDNDLCELWFRQDDKFLLPNAVYEFYLISPHAIASPKSASLTSLLPKVLEYQFTEKLYPAMIAESFYDCSSFKLGINFTVSGFNQKLHLIVDTFVECLKSLLGNCTESEFKMAIQQQLKLYEKFLFEPETLTDDLSACAAGRRNLPIYEKIKYLCSATFADFQEFYQKFIEKMRIKALIQGNVTKSHALNIVNKMLTELKFEKIENPSSIVLKALKLPNGSNYLRCKNFNVNDINSSILNVYQIGQYSYKSQVLLDLLSIVAEESLFHNLRTIEQLAYSVGLYIYKSEQMLSYEIRVDPQETKFTAEYVDERIENFRGILTTTIENLSDDDFSAFKKSLARNKLKEFNELWDEMQSNWTEIHTNQYEFDRRHKEVECLSTITKDQLLEFHRAYSGPNGRKLSIQVIGNAHGNESKGGNETNVESQQNNSFDRLSYVDFSGEPKGHLIGDFMAFRNNLDTCPN